MSKSSIKKNFIYNIFYQVLAIIVPLITSPYLARVLGAEKIGINTWTYSVVFYFMIFATLGVNNYGNRSIAYIRDDKDELSRKFWSIYSCQAFASTMVIFIYIIYLVYFANKYKLIASLQILYILGNAFDITWFFYGLEEFKITVARNSFVKIMGLVAIFIFVQTPNDLWKYTLIVSGTSFLGQIFLWPLVLKRIRFVRVRLCDMIPHIKPICVLFIPVLAISIFANMDKYMIGLMSNMSQTGFYENANKIIEIPKAVITALGTVMLPRTANLIATGNEEKSKVYIRNTMIYTILLGSAFVFGMAAVAETFSVIFWGEDFVTSGRLIAVMAPAILFSVFGNVIRTQYLIPRSKDKEYTISLLVGAIINFSINYMLIPKMGAMGASVATVISEFCMTFLQSFYVRKSLDIKNYLLDNYMFIVIGSIMFGVVKVIGNYLSVSIGTLLVMIISGALVYVCLIAILLKMSRKENIQLIRKLVCEQRYRHLKR